MEPKKRSLGAAQRDEFLRAARRALVVRGTDPGRFVFVDECSTNTSMSPLRAWSRRAERALCSAPRNRGPNVTLLSSMSAEGMGPSMAVEGSTTREVFEAYLEQALAPALKPGQIVVMDNLSAHKGGRVREIVEGRGCELLYLPPHSPDLNPIEEAFSKIKGLLRGFAARIHDALVVAMGRALSAVKSLDARGFFAHCGHGPVGQLLRQAL